MAADVDAFMAALDHPLKAEIEMVRRIILGADKSIAELIKWKAPSFRTTDDFATLHLRSSTVIQIIFHTGARAKGSTVAVDDPTGLLKRLAADRCIATLPSDVESAREPLSAIVRQWIGQI